MDKTLAIVIPYYKPEYLRELLQSLRNQSNKNFNLYIGNDCSPNDPKEIINDYADIITKYKKYNKNVGANNLNLHWNRCIEDLVENEEWIMILCDDDLIEFNVIEAFYGSLSIIESHNIKVIRYATKVVDKENSIVLKEYNCENIIENSTFLFEQKILEKTRSSLSEYIFSKSAFSKHKFRSFHLSFGSDNVAWLEFSDFSSIFCINDSYVRYRYSNLSISGDETLKKGKMQGEIEYLDYLIQNYKDKFSHQLMCSLYERHYHYFRSINRENKLSLLKTFYQMTIDIGFAKAFKIIKNNKNYFKKLYYPS